MLHVAVLMRQYIDLLLRGKKSVECRLTQTAREPFETIEAGDRVFFKQSSGPYRATAIVEHVHFERDLTPQRIREVRRDYNDLIRGEPSYWSWKRDARYLSLIWLKEVEPTARGPVIPELRGRAWVCLGDSASLAPPRSGPRPSTSTPGADKGLDDPFTITVTAGNLRNGTLYITGSEDRFPADAFGGATRADAGAPLTLILRDGPMVETDVVGPKKLIRSRIWRTWFERIRAAEGDRVVFTPAGSRLYFVDLARESEKPR